jgi:hypothetical protein
MLHSLRHVHVETEGYLGMIAMLGPPDPARLKSRPGPARGDPFRLW